MNRDFYCNWGGFQGMIKLGSNIWILLWTWYLLVCWICQIDYVSFSYQIISWYPNLVKVWVWKCIVVFLYIGVLNIYEWRLIR